MKILTTVLALTFLTSIAQASCVDAYKTKSKKMLPQSPVGQGGMVLGTYLVVASAMAGTIVLGAGPVGVLVFAPAIAYDRKVKRIEFYSDLIQSVNAHHSTNFINWSAPEVETFWGDFETAGPDNYNVGQTIFDRIRNHVLRESGNVTDQQIAEAIYKADLNNEFCRDEKDDVNLKTSVRKFARVIAQNL